ncbi:peptidase, partial [Streptomyces sp. NPDC058964]
RRRRLARSRAGGGARLRRPASATAPAFSARAAATAPDAEALRAAIAGLPDADTTAALVRVGGTDGGRRGSAGVHDLVSGRAADPKPTT